MKKALLYITLMLLTILISCELKEDDTSTGGDTVDPTEETITVSSPASGDTLLIAGSHEITWTSTTSSNLNIEYTTDNQKTWNLIATDIEDVGSFIWSPIPNQVSDICRIKVVTVDSTTEGISSGFFSIVEPPTKSIEVKSPNGGEFLIVSESHLIEWTSTSVNNVSIEFSNDNGENWRNIIESYPADSGKYNWDPIPNFTSETSLIRIADVSADTVSDVSDNVFSISIPREIIVTSPNGGENWIGNTSENITWFSSEVSNVKIEYTLNNGVTWQTIVESTESDGFYTWEPVPNQPSSNAKIRITNVEDGFPSDESNSVFSIEPELFITVLSPNGEEEWLSGSGHFIQWTTSTPDITPAGVVTLPLNESREDVKVGLKKSKLKKAGKLPAKAHKLSPDVTRKKGASGNSIQSISHVKIEFSTNNGAEWTTITESTPNDGNFLWNPIPPRNSVLCVVRISDAEDFVPFDISDNSFTIVENPTVEIIVTSPDGGEEWSSGSSQTIAWTSTGVESVDIEYSTNNGVDWILIDDNVPSSGFYTWAQVPNTASNNCKIRISGATIGVPFDESNGTFSILPEPDIKILSPNGGETLQTGTSNNITWTSENIENVKIELTTNNGASWQVIEASTPSDGNYNWTTIPDLNSTLCKIRVSDANDGIPFDLSDEIFSITNQIEQTIQVLVPDGGELWEANTSKTITWESNGIDSVKIEYSSNNGIEWVTIENSIKSLGSYDWSVPDVSSTQSKIRISDSRDLTPFDESNSTFTLKQPGTLSLTAPNSGDVWVSGDLNRIEWVSENVEKVKIEYTTKPIDYNPNSITFEEDWFLLSDGTPAGPGVYETRFTTISETYKIRLSDAELGTPESFSGFFRVKEAVSKSITVESPNGNESLFANASYSIKWVSSNVQYVDIEFTTNNGATWQLIADSTESDGIHTWPAVPDISSSLCKIRISDNDDSQFFDESDNVFEIVNDNQYLRVTLPNGGEDFQAGTTQEITWTTTGIENVRIELTTNNGLDWSTIVSSTPSDGHYTWNQVPSTSSTNCRIKISDAEDGMPSDDSDALFTISPEPNVTVLSPNGGESYLTGTSTNITWTSVNIANVKIEYTINGGAEWIVIADNTTSDGSFLWENIPDLNSSLCQVRISDAVDGAPFDMSDNFFNITNQVEQSVEVVLPNGGEVWDAGTSKLLSWASNGIDEVKIEYTSNNGISWELIADNVANTGSFDWTVPNINSTQAKVRISDSDDNQPIDESNATFTIKQAGLLKINKPATGDVWISGDLNRIEWEAENIEKIKIEFTMTDAIYDPNAEFFDDSWFTLTEDAPGAAGFYETRFTTPSNLYRLRISDSELDSPVDFSGLFTVKERPVKSITVTSPNGGESLFEGASYSIQWISSNVEFVDIHFSTNNGASWELVADRTESDGIYTWASVPDISSSLCKIRISDDEDDQFFDESNAVFEIVNENQLLTVSAPNGGETWQAGTTQDITWQTTGVENVRIELTTNNGIDWATIVTSTPSDGHYTWNQVPSSVSTNCKIKISDAADGMPSDDSDDFFTIAPEPGITVVSPNGGENYLTGTSTSISWTSVNVANVKIEYTTNGGANWETIVSSTGSDGLYLWENIPNLNSALCQVRISDASDGSPFDISDGYFNITNQVEETISIISPNGGEEFDAGTKQNITWQATGVARVDVQFTTNNGLTWTDIAVDIENSGAVEWDISLGINSPQCKIRVKDNIDDVPTDESDGTFTVKPAQSITVTAPIGGEVFQAGEGILLEWTSTGIENVGIRYTTTNGLGSSQEPSFYTVTGSAPNTGEYSTSFSIASSEYYVEVFDAEDGSPVGRSIGNFTILPQVTNSITIVSPNGGEKLLVNETQEIQWQSQGVEFVNLEYSVNGGATFADIATNEPSDGIYLWTVPDIATSDNCVLRISDASSVSIFDESNSLFSIQQRFLRVTSPNGGELLDYDNGHFITWESAGVTMVDLYISYNNGASWDVIITGLTNTGGYEWDPPDIVTNLARIKIEETGNPSLSDISDGFFALDNDDDPFRSFIQIVTPQKDFVYPAGVDLDIRWNNSRDIISVDIDFSGDNGVTWTNLVAGYTQIKWNEENSYTWVAPPVVPFGRVRITGYDSTGAVVAVFWSEPFEIQ